jgi:hypothetical protein
MHFQVVIIDKKGMEESNGSYCIWITRDLDAGNILQKMPIKLSFLVIITNKISPGINQH